MSDDDLMPATKPMTLTKTYTGSAEDMTAALALVVTYLDDVGPDPTVSIRPVWTVDGDDKLVRRFLVSIQGSVEEGA